MKIETEFSIGDKVFCFDGSGFIKEVKIIGIDFSPGGYFRYKVEDELPNGSFEFTAHYYRAEKQIGKTRKLLLKKYL